MNDLAARYEDGLHLALTDPQEAAAYLNAALEEDDQQIFLLALRDIAEAHGFTQTDQAASLTDETLYRLLTATDNPQLTSLNALLHTMGLRLTIEVA